MIVVHAYDQETRFFQLVYENLPEVRFFSGLREREKLLEALRSAPREEFILLLGRGSPYGLAGGLLRDSDAGLLRDRPNLIGIWNMASTFAIRHGLKGFFSGAFVSDPCEAFCEGICDDLEEKSWDFAGRLGDLLRGGFSLPAIAEIMTEGCYQDCRLTRYNYPRLTFRVRGDEPLPVKEDYWGYDEELLMTPSLCSRPLTNGEVIERGLSEIRTDWQEDFLGDMLTGINPEVRERAYEMSEACLSVLFKNAASWAEGSRPGAKKMVEAVSRELGERVQLTRLRKWVKPIYIISLPGHDYLLWQQGEMRETFLSWSDGENVYPIRISVGPEAFASLLGQFHFEILPMVAGSLEDYGKELQKRVMLGRIRQAANPGDDSEGRCNPVL